MHSAFSSCTWPRWTALVWRRQMYNPICFTFDTFTSVAFSHPGSVVPVGCSIVCGWPTDCSVLKALLSPIMSDHVRLWCA
eukprot:125685-Chlamydomonas_euryale.AAC.3